MDYESFHAMSPEVARAYLERFLEVERDAILETIALAANDGVQFDYSITTLPECLKWMSKQLRLFCKPLPAEVPDWVKHVHPLGIFEFDDDSKTMLLRAAYYLGECFARLPGFSWTVGDAEYMEKHMPVVAGFDHSLELPALVVAQNMFLKIASNGAPLSEIDSIIATWLRDTRASG